jgi:hypothetical protein
MASTRKPPPPQHNALKSIRMTVVAILDESNERLLGNVSMSVEEAERFSATGPTVAFTCLFPRQLSYLGIDGHDYVNVREAAADAVAEC